MNPRSYIEELERVLSEEREAIVRLDGKAVAEAADAKERILAALTAANLNDGSLAEPLSRVIASLRRNGVLLAHGRACLRDALAAVRHGATDGPHVSVRW